MSKNTRSSKKVSAKSQDSLQITITNNEILDAAFLKEYGSIEQYLLYKVIEQYDEIAFYRRKITSLKKELRAAESAVLVACSEK